MKIKLNLKERINLLKILPKEASLITQKLIYDMISILSPTEQEFLDYEIKQSNDQITWNKKAIEDKEFEIGIKSISMVNDVLTELDNEKKVTQDYLSLFTKFGGV